ncbi:MAG: hypothetical protein ABIJ39_04480 [Chloroflexota bacterium]
MTSQPPDAGEVFLGKIYKESIILVVPLVTMLRVVTGAVSYAASYAPYGDALGFQGN